MSHVANEYLYWEYPDQIGHIAVRLGKWKGIISGTKKGNDEIRLYDLEKDIQELEDVSASNPETVARIRAIVEKEHTPYEY